MKKICIMGLTARADLGKYEQQLGNVAIIIPVAQLLKKYINDGEIYTTIQLSDDFCSKYGLIRIDRQKIRFPYLIFQWVELADALFSFVCVSIWALFKRLFNIELGVLVKREKFKNLEKFDIFLDFHGDILPNDLRLIPLFIHTLNIMIIRRLNKPIVEFVNSPGPFDSLIKKILSKIIFKNVIVILDREPLSSQLVKAIGVTTPVITTACPAFLLAPATKEHAEKILLKEKIVKNGNPLIGFTLAGYNLYSFKKWDNFKHFDDLDVYIPVIRYLLDDLNATVIFIPHVYRNNNWTGDFIQGPDYMILKQLYEKVGGDKYQGRLKILKGIFTSSEVKSVIGQCDLFIGGRMHACVAAVSQSVPTVFLAYGIKHFGMARHIGLEKYVVDGKNPNITLSVVQDAWKNKENIRQSLNKRLIRIFELTELNFEIIRDVLLLDLPERLNPPNNLIEIWKEKGE